MTEGRRGTSLDKAAMSGEGLEVANAIAQYLKRANGDTRLALAFSVADAVAVSRIAARAAGQRACH